MSKLIEETENHYQNQLMRQIHVVVLGLDVLGNPFGIIRGVAEGIESFFYEPYKVSTHKILSSFKNHFFFQGAMEGPIQFIEGIAIGTRNLLGSAVGGAANAVAKVTGVASKGLATLTFDENYQNARIARKEIAGHNISDVLLSGKNIGKVRLNYIIITIILCIIIFLKDVAHGVKGVVKKPVAEAKEKGSAGFIEGLGKGFLELVARPASGIADFTSTSFDVIKRLVNFPSPFVFDRLLVFLY